MINADDLKDGDYYWYVFVPTTAINLQIVKLEKIVLENLSSELSTFRVVKNDGVEEYLTVSMIIEPENGKYQNMFPINQKDEAELLWAKEFFKNFEEINGVEFCKFVDLYKKIQKEKPEWII